jgi:hypothetical protein
MTYDDLVEAMLHAALPKDSRIAGQTMTMKKGTK